MPSELERRLQALHRGPQEQGRVEHGEALRSSVMADFERCHGTSASRGARAARWALTGVMGTALAVGACALPAEYPVALGYGLEIVVDETRFEGVDPDALALHLRRDAGAERVEVRVSHTRDVVVLANGGEWIGHDLRIQLFLFGGTVAPDQVWDELQDEFPALADAEVHDVPLSATVEGTLGGKLSHRFLDVIIDRHGVEEAERRILADLVAEGIDPDHAVIDITDTRGPDGHRRIEVRVEADRVDETEPRPQSSAHVENRND